MDNNTAARLSRKDESALEEIIREYTPYVSTIIYNVSRGSLSVSDMEEAAADVFITLWKNSEKVKAETLKGYIAAIAKSRAKDKIRSISGKAAIVDIEDAELADEYTLSDSVDSKELSRDIENAVNTLGEPDREIVIRYYYYYQTTPKISEMLGINADTVKTKLRRARAKLRAALEDGTTVTAFDEGRTADAGTTETQFTILYQFFTDNGDGSRMHPIAIDPNKIVKIEAGGVAVYEK